MIRVPGVIKGSVRAPLPFLTKTSLCTLMWFANKCTYLKHNSLPGLHVGALKPLVWEAYIWREGHWPIHTEEGKKEKTHTFMVSSNQMYNYYFECHLNMTHHRSPSQIPHVHYHIFNWLARSVTWSMCHEMLNKTLLGEETTAWWQPQVKSCFKWPVSGCKWVTPQSYRPDKCWCAQICKKEKRLHTQIK